MAGPAGNEAAARSWEAAGTAAGEAAGSVGEVDPAVRARVEEAWGWWAGRRW